MNDIGKKYFPLCGKGEKMFELVMYPKVEPEDTVVVQDRDDLPAGLIKGENCKINIIKSNR